MHDSRINSVLASALLLVYYSLRGLKAKAVTLETETWSAS